MSGQEHNKRLSAVLIADIAGYTKLVEKDTDATVSAWNSARDNVIDPTVASHSGRIVKLTGDGFLAEFSVVQNAVNCAIELQEGLANNPLNFRIGINLGDIVDDGQDIHGEGVNIAARIEALAEPGGITIAGGVYEQIRNRVPASFTDLGDHTVKHVTAPVRVYSVNINIGSPPQSAPTAKGSDLGEPSNLDRNPRLLILPFRNSSGNQDNEDLVDGIVEDLITEFSQIKSIEVISNATAFSFKEKEVDIKELQTRLSLDFVLSGSVRSSRDRVRISVELLDPYTDNTVWSQRYDRVLDDIFEVQDEVVRGVMFALNGEIEVKTLERAHRKPTENLTSYEYLVKGKRLHHKYQKETHLEALQHFNKAIEMDPHNGSAYAWKACTVGGGMARGFFTPDDEVIKESPIELIKAAQDINENDFECYRILCRVHLNVNSDHQKACEYGRRAHELNPNDPRILWGYGLALALSGDGEEAAKLFFKAYELSPNMGAEGTADDLVSGLVLANFVSGNYAECVDWFGRLEKTDFRSFLLYVACLEQMASLEEELGQVATLAEAHRDIDKEAAISLFRFKDPGITESLLDLNKRIYAA